MYKHYIRVNDNSEVIAAFSNAFQLPSEGDILLRETEERHCNLELQREGEYLWAWDGTTMIQKSEQGLAQKWEKKRRKAWCLGRLRELDGVIPRSVEDLYKLVGANMHQTTKKVVEEKEALREELQGLGD